MAQSIQRGLTREQDFQTALSEIPSDIELKWGKGISSEEVRQAPILKNIFEGIETASNAIIVGTEVLSQFIDVLSAVADILSVVIGIGVDLFEGLIIVLKELLELIKSLFTELSFNFIHHFPTDVKARRKPSEILYDLGMSYLDSKDPNRPIARVGSVGVVFIAMYSLPNPQVFLDKLNTVLANLRAIGSDVERVQRHKVNSSYKTTQYAEEGSQGQNPNWSLGVSLLDLPAIKSGWTGELDNVIKSLASNRGYAEKINTALNTARARLARINKSADILLQTTASVSALIALGDANGLLAIRGSGTNRDFATAIINSPNHPDYPKSELNELNYGNYQPITGPNPILADSAMFSGATALHFQSPIGSQTIDLLEVLFSTMIKPKVGGADITLEEYARSVTSPINDRIQTAFEGDGYKTAWVTRKDQEPN